MAPDCTTRSHHHAPPALDNKQQRRSRRRSSSSDDNDDTTSTSTGTSCSNNNSMARSPSLALIVHPAHAAALAQPPVPLSFFEQVDDAVLRQIAGMMACAQSLVRLMLVSQRFRRIAECPYLWRELCVARFNVPPSLPPPVCWRSLFGRNVELFQQVLARSAAEALMRLGIAPRAPAGGFVLPAPLMA